MRRDGVDYILYLRWRWQDPWQGYVITNAWDSDSMHEDDVVWSEDLLGKHELFYGVDDHILAQKALEKLFWEYAYEK